MSTLGLLLVIETFILRGRKPKRLKPLYNFTEIVAEFPDFSNYIVKENLAITDRNTKIRSKL